MASNMRSSMTPGTSRRRPQRPDRRPRPGLEGTHTRRLHNVTTPADPAHPVHEVRVEHGGVYVLSHLPRQRAETYVGANLFRLHRAAEEVRRLLPERYRSRVTAALVVPAGPEDRFEDSPRHDVAARVGGVLVLDAGSLANAVRCAAPALSTSEMSAVAGLLRQQLKPAAVPTAGKSRRWRSLPRLRSARGQLQDAA